MGFTFAGRCRMAASAIVFGALWSSAIACVAQQPAQGKPPFQSIETATNAEFQAYLRTLTFSPDLEVGDRQALLVGRYPDSARYGPLASVVPELHSHEGSLGDLKWGKLIAKVVNESAEPYPKLGLLPHGTTYWWVQYDSAAGKGSSVFVAVDTANNIVSRTQRGLYVKTEHKTYRVTEALAHFIWENDDDLLWGTCNGACCHALK